MRNHWNLARLGATATVATVIAAGAVVHAQDAPMEAADVIYENAFVYTVDAARSTATAFAVSGGKFVAIG